MGKKAIWILVAVLALALIGTASIIGVNQWKASQAKAEAVTQQKLKADQEQAILDRDEAFVASMKASDDQLAGGDPENIVAFGKGLCEVMTEEGSAGKSSPPHNVAFYLATLDDDPSTATEAAHAVSLSVSTYCPEHGPATFETIQSALQADEAEAEAEERAEAQAKAEAQRKKELEEQAESKANVITIEKFISAVRKNVSPFKRASDSELIETGQAVCHSIKLGVSTENIVIAAQQDNVGMTMEEAYFFVGGSIGAFCWEETN